MSIYRHNLTVHKDQFDEFHYRPIFTLKSTLKIRLVHNVNGQLDFFTIVQILLVKFHDIII